MAEDKYEIPLGVEIVRASVDASGDFILEAKVENAGQIAVELPISRNISDVQRTRGDFRRELYFIVRPMASDNRLPNVVGVTAGSHAVPHSLVLLEPQQSIRVLLRVESRWVKDALPKDGKELHLRITCGELALENERFFVESTAEDVISSNTVVLGFNADSPTAIVSGP